MSEQSPKALTLPSDNTSAQMEASIVDDIASLELAMQQQQQPDDSMDGTQEPMETLASLSPSPATTTAAAPTTVAAPSPSQVFAPKPIRAPFPTIFRPIPQRLHKGSFGQQLDDSPLARSPSPASGGLVLQRRSSSAASTAADAPGGWNVMGLQSRLAESTSASDIDNEKETTNSSGDSNPLLQMYSPSKDVLDELYKIIRNNKSYPFNNLRDLNANSTSPLYRNRTPTKTPSSPSQHRRQISDACTTPDGSLLARTPDREWSKIVFPSSPISRTSMRNPVLFNSQFAATEFLQKMQ
ncbi:hypothetical protein DFH27DRAFT_526630 [Peziza echinospora]|nr:hypothetical protein DFH27DRAFT_526630 [Peziza echinospora]